MKLKQNEYCHNCQQYVDFEFDDVTDRQIIYCPRCGHEHYRELDEGTIINIRMESQHGQVEVAQMDWDNMPSFDSDVVCEMPIIHKTFKIIGQTADGRPIVEKTNEIEGATQSKTITQRRWGRDRRQS